MFLDRHRAQLFYSSLSYKDSNKQIKEKFEQKRAKKELDFIVFCCKNQFFLLSWANSKNLPSFLEAEQASELGIKTREM